MSKDMNARAQEAKSDSAVWFPTVTYDPESWPLWALNICGESGELANVVKKMVRGSATQDQTLPRAADELVDVMVYCFNMAAALGIDLEAEYDRKREFNDKRFRGPSDS